MALTYPVGKEKRCCSHRIKREVPNKDRRCNPMQVIPLEACRAYSNRNGCEILDARLNHSRLAEWCNRWPWYLRQRFLFSLLQVFFFVYSTRLRDTGYENWKIMFSDWLTSDFFTYLNVRFFPLLENYPSSFMFQLIRSEFRQFNAKFHRLTRLKLPLNWQMSKGTRSSLYTRCLYPQKQALKL